MIPVSCFLYYNVCLQEIFMESAAWMERNTTPAGGTGNVIVTAPAEAPLRIK